MPEVTYFKPRGVPLRDLTEVYLSVEGFEALRLADVAGLKHEEAAQQMNVSRQTFSRVLAAARKAVAEAVVSGLALRIQGGHYEVQGPGRSGRTAPAIPAARPEEGAMSKIAVSSEGPTLDDQVDPRFGRAAGFVIVDPTTMEIEYLDNGASQARGQGAGIQAAELVAGRGVGVVLTGYVGPKAFTALRAAGIRIGADLDGLSVRQAVERFVRGQVNPIDRPNR